MEFDDDFEDDDEERNNSMSIDIDNLEEDNSNIIITIYHGDSVQARKKLGFHFLVLDKNRLTKKLKNQKVVKTLQNLKSQFLKFGHTQSHFKKIKGNIFFFRCWCQVQIFINAVI